MSRSGEVALTCWDGEYTFRLTIGEIEKLQEACDAGPLHIMQRLHDGTWKTQDVRETLRRGLIGAGTSQADALRLINAHCDSGMLLQNALIARVVIAAAVAGPEDEPSGEAGAAAPDQSASPTGNSASPGSTPPAP